jgi:hypothetical protein
MLSVLFSIGALTALAWLATLAEIPVATTLLIALLSYGFAYTGIIARSFACAQCLNIFGMALTIKGSKDQNSAYALAGGSAFGAAGFSNYLAIFIGAGTLFWLLIAKPAKKLTAFTALGLALFLPPIGYFFVAQHNSRIGQFTAFSPINALILLAKDNGAALFGGLPLCAGRAGNFVTATLAILITICAGFIVKNWQKNLSVFAVAALATPAGLLALGCVFKNTPIEIRYLAFSLPFIALLLAQTLPRRLLYLVLCIEACGIAGLIIAPATMQPQGLAARQLRKLATPASLILLPFGNDGVGVPGPFIASVPNHLRLELIKPGRLPNLAREPRVILVMIQIDAASKQATTSALKTFSTDPCWIENSSTNLVRIFIQTCRGSLKSH